MVPGCNIREGSMAPVSQVPAMDDFFSTEEVLLQGQKRNFTYSLICLQKLKLPSFCGQREYTIHR
jgi:hypothetical protein